MVNLEVRYLQRLVTTYIFRIEVSIRVH
jgi:hypothetical protein